jgi:hypothetical protein
MNPSRRFNSLSSINLWRRGPGRGGSFFDGRLTGRLDLQNRTRIDTMNRSAIRLPLLHKLVEERAGERWLSSRSRFTGRASKPTASTNPAAINMPYMFGLFQSPIQRGP